MSELTVEMQKDLEKKLDHLCFIHDQTALFLTDEFFDLSKTIDIETEELLARFQDAGLNDEADEVVNVNKTREELIKILRELEERCHNRLLKRNALSFREAYNDLVVRNESFKDCQDDQLKKAYIELATELLDEIYLLEKRLLGEYTVAYISSSDKSQLGHLLYISEDRLRRHEIEFLRDIFKSGIFDNFLSPELKHASLKNLPVFLLSGLESSCIVKKNAPFIVNKNYMILQSLAYYLQSSSAVSLPKFIYMTKDVGTYTDYSAEYSSIHKQMLGYRLPSEENDLHFQHIGGISTECDLLAFAPERCELTFFRCQLNNLDFLASSYRDRLEKLSLHGVSIEDFDEDCISGCVNLQSFFTTSHDICFSSLEFLRPLKKLLSVRLYVRELDADHLEVLKELRYLKDIGFNGVAFGEIKRPKVNAEKVLAKLVTLPCLVYLSFADFDIDRIGKHAFAGFKRLIQITLSFNTIGFIDKEAFDTNYYKRVEVNMYKNQLLNKQS